jgi:hypothetical protein
LSCTCDNSEANTLEDTAAMTLSPEHGRARDPRAERTFGMAISQA